MVSTEGKLKLIHLVYLLVLAGVLAGIAWGSMKNQQKTNTKEIGQKINNELFQMHQTQQTEQMQKIDGKLDKIDEKLEKILIK